MLQPVNLIPRNRWREEARAALADAGLGGYERSTVGSLPYGVQKQIELVRALMAHPRLLLLDEPAAGLNAGESKALQLQLETICARHDLTLLVVEHDMQFIGALCEEVIVLDFGRKIAEGTPEEIRRGPAGAGDLSRRADSRRPWSGRVQLELHDLDVRYGRVHAVRGVSMRLCEGETVAVLGANGAGKSSLLRAVLGLVRLSGGSVMLDGRNISAGRPPRGCAADWCWFRKAVAS